MPEEGQSEWTAQALVAVGAVLLLITAFWLGVYAPGKKMLSDDFETTYEYGGELKVLDQTTFVGAAVMNMDVPEGYCFCTNYANAIATHVLVADPAQSDDEETFYNENFSVFGNADGSLVAMHLDVNEDGLPDSYLFTLKDGNSWVDRKTYESRAEGSEADDYSYSTWNPNYPPAETQFKFPNPFVPAHENTYVYQGETEVDGVAAYVYEADESVTPIPYTPGPKSPLISLLALGASFHISYIETVTVDATHGTALDRVFDITVYAAFPDHYAPGGGLYLTDGMHFPSEASYSGTLFDLANGINGNLTATKTTSVVTAVPGLNNTTVDPTTDTHLLTNTAFAVYGEGIPFDLNSDGALVSPATMFVNRSSHQVGSPLTGFANTFPHMYTNVSAAAGFPNAFNPSYNTMYTPTDAANWSGGVAHFTGVPVNSVYEPVIMPYGTLYNYIEMALDENETSPTYGMHMPTGESQQVLAPLPDADLNLTDNGSWMAYSFGSAGPAGMLANNVPVSMSYEENVWFDPHTGTVQNQMYNVTVYADMTVADDQPLAGMVVAQMTLLALDIEYSDEQKAAYATSMAMKAAAMYYSGKTIPVMDLDGGFTSAAKADGIEAANERISGLKLLDTYVPGLLIVLALGCLIGGFYFYYQEGEGGDDFEPAAPAPEPEDDDGGGDDAGDSADDDSGGDDADDGGDSDD